MARRPPRHADAARNSLTTLGPGPNVSPMTTAAATAAELPTAHLRRAVFTEAGRMMHAPATLDAYRAELLTRRAD